MSSQHGIGWPAPPWAAGRRGREHPLWLSLKVGVPQVLITYLAAHNNPVSGRKDLDALAFALLVIGPLALALRRRWPVAVLAVNLAVTEAYYLLGYQFGPAFLSLAVAFWTTLAAGERRKAWLLAGIGYVSYFGLAQVAPAPRPGLGPAIGLAAWLLLVLVAAEVARGRREQAAEALRTREEESRRQASEERLRIARELHDVVAHNISLINVQASTALHLIDQRPEQARTALAAIKQASKETLGELRSVLDILRQGDEMPPRSPAPSLERLDDLVSRVRAAGLEVLTKVEGDPRPLPARVDLAAYRIVQEALTNVHRHAGPATATVRVLYGDRDLTVQVDDDGKGEDGKGDDGKGVESAPGRQPTDSDRQVRRSEPTDSDRQVRRSGIVGMRERATALGGELEAARRPEGGFRVLARLPLDGGA